MRGKSTLWLVPEYLYSLDLDSTEAAYQAQHDALSQPDVILSPDQAAQLRVADYQLAKLASIREKLQTIKDEDIQVAVSHTPLTRDYVTTMMAWTEKTQTFSFHHVSLILAGHYCGGQWRLPSGGALYCPAYGWFPEDQLITGAGYLNGIPNTSAPDWAQALLFLPARPAFQQSRHDLPTANQPYQLNNGQKETAHLCVIPATMKWTCAAARCCQRFSASLCP